jgi:PPM family protein phosphatase
MNDSPVVRCASETDVGMRRATNQDSLFTRVWSDGDDWRRCGHLFVVADGMGGHAVGDLASRIAVETFSETFLNETAASDTLRLQQGMLAAIRAVHMRGRQNPEFSDMGTTCSALSITQNGAFIAHIGDSRIYRIRGDVISQLTFDHSLQWEMIRLGRVTAANVDLYHPRNVITRCVGPDPDVQIDIEGPFSVESGDRFILCSDGLSNHLTDSELGQIAGTLSPSDAARLMINLANLRGGTDNASVILVCIESAAGFRKEFSDETVPAAAGVDESLTDTNSAEPAGRSTPFRLVCAAIILILLGGIPLFLRPRHPAVVVSLLLSTMIPIWFLLRSRTIKPLQIETRTDADFTLSLNEDESPDEQQTIPGSPPYRQASALLTRETLDKLSQIADQLLQTARDECWTISLEELNVRNRDADEAYLQGKLQPAIALRARVIDILYRYQMQKSRMAASG